MDKRKYPEFLAFIIAVSLGFLFQRSLWGWSNPILVTSDTRFTYDKPQVKFDPAGNSCVLYTAATANSRTSNVFLSRFNGSSVQFLHNVSETSQHAYEGDIGVSATGQIHVAWAEYNLSNPSTHYIRYRSSSGSSWSSIQTLGQVTSTDLVEDLRLAVDGNNNVFVVFMIWPLARCKFISKYGSVVRMQDFPVSGRSKHPDVAADNAFVYIAWQHMLSGQYTILSQKKVNSASGSWQSTQDLRHYDTQRPRIDADSSRNQHVVYWHDLGATRKMFYKYWLGSGFSTSKVVSDPVDYLVYHFADFEVAGSQMIATMQLGGYYGGQAVFYNLGQKGSWGKLEEVPGTRSLNPAMASVDMTAAGKIIVAVASTNQAIYLIDSEGENPDPPPPPPINEPPSARFIFNPLSGLYPLSVNFDARSSIDSDGTIVSYEWDFGDGNKGKGAVVSHVYNQENRYRISLKVTDDDGATATASGELEVFGIAPPLNLQYQRHENRNLFSIEYLFRITWNHNPHNDEIGAKIALYKIYRREVGKGGFAHLFTVEAGNLTEFEYLDRTLGSTARVYEYNVSSVDTAGRESHGAASPLSQFQEERGIIPESVRLQTDVH